MFRRQSQHLNLINILAALTTLSTGRRSVASTEQATVQNGNDTIGAASRVTITQQIRRKVTLIIAATVAITSCIKLNSG